VNNQRRAEVKFPPVTYNVDMEKKQNTAQIPAVAEKLSLAYCPICRKLLHVEKGQVIPRCCGKTMQILE